MSKRFINILTVLIAGLLMATCGQKSNEPVNLKLSDLRVEYKVNPLGVDIPKPRFSWVMEADARGERQVAYQIMVASDEDKLASGDWDMWDSGKISSDASIQIFYDGKPLESNKKYFWKVKVWDQHGNRVMSEPAFWTTGLFHVSDWKAKWIGLDRAVGIDDPDAPHRVLSARMLRHEFEVKKKVKNAMAFVSGLGLFEMYINGQKIGDQVLAPALTEYDKRTFYMTFDVTEALKNGQNAIGVILGNGRYFAPRTSEPTKTRTYGFPKLLCQIAVEYEDGSRKIIASDETWKLTADGPIRKNNEYDGEYYDARMEMPGWAEAGFDDSAWMDAELVEKPGELLVCQPNEPIKIMDEVKPVKVNEVQPGVFIFDMGQNMVGWVELRVKGKRGDKVTMRFAERLNDDGTLFLDNIRGAEVTDTYILKGEGEETWQPRFTYHGFRYVEMKGFPGKPTLNAITGKVVHDALELSGSFTCSNPLINQIYKNAYWGIRGNYRSMPTDCPQRDERQGWLGDRSAESTGESYIFNISNLYNKWLTDMMDAQREDGSIPDVAPSYWPIYSDNTTWPGTYLFATDMLYTQYGDLKAVRTHYPHMQKWIEHMSQYIKDGIMTKDTYGDWCAPPEEPSLIHTSDPRRTTAPDYIGTAYFYHELLMMAKFARLLSKEGDAKDYENRAAEMKKAFNDRFFDENEMIYSNNSHTVNILALAFDLVPEEYRQKVVSNLLQKILGDDGGHVGNGIVGGQWLMRTLTNTGHADVAWLLATQDTYPSWGYMVRQGATTIWELWNGDHGDPGMNSGNHVMLLGDLIIWFYENLAGIKPDPQQPAFKHLIMKPQPVEGLDFVKASYKSIYGRVSSEWQKKDGEFSWKITIPANTTATVYVPTLNKEQVLEGGKPAGDSDFIEFVRWDGNFAVFEVQSGDYVFTSEGAEMPATQRYVPTPVIEPFDKISLMGETLEVTITCPDEAATIHYTLDGTIPDTSSPVYEKPLKIHEPITLRAKAYRDGYQPSVVISTNFDFVDPAVNGLNWKLYRGAWKKIPDLSKLKPVDQGVVYKPDFSLMKTPRRNFALRFDGFVKIDKPGKYTFYTVSNDGSKLYIDGKLIVDNDGEHGTKQLGGSLQLDKGLHAIRVEYFQSGGSRNLSVFYKAEGIPYQPVPGSAFFLKKE